MMKIQWWHAPVLLCAICLCGSAETFAQAQPAPTTDAPRQEQSPAQPQPQTAQGATTAEVDGRVPLAETALSRGTAGEILLAGTLRAGTLRAAPTAGTVEAPIQNVRFVVENRSPAEYSYLSGRVTFYDGAGVRCGEGLFTANSLVPGERAEVDAPGLRLVCTPATWRISPVALVSGGTLVTPGVTSTTNLNSPSNPTNTVLNSVPGQRLSIEINGTTMPVQIGNPIEVEVGGERVRIIVTNARP